MPESSDNLLKQLNTTLPVLTPEAPEMIQFLPAGHKMNEPSPLFARIEPSRAEELKKQFAGKQGENGKAKVEDAKGLEGDVARQADKVRKLKASGAGKDVWQPEVNVLLDLKKRLEAAQKSAGVAVQNGVGDAATIKRLEEDVAKQVGISFEIKSRGFKSFIVLGAVC